MAQSKEDVDNWAKDPVHLEAKKKAKQWYPLGKRNTRGDSRCTIKVNGLCLILRFG